MKRPNDVFISSKKYPICKSKVIHINWLATHHDRHHEPPLRNCAGRVIYKEGISALKFLKQQFKKNYMVDLDKEFGIFHVDVAIILFAK